KLGGSACNGLAAVGSSKTGSMLYFENFYGPMGNGKAIGDAFVAWWKALGAAHDLGMRQWFYGLTLLGDPTLNWWTGVVPALRNPYDGDNFDHFPRLTTFQWDPVAVGGAPRQVVSRDQPDVADFRGADGNQLRASVRGCPTRPLARESQDRQLPRSVD
nr:hypothetical protein [Pirellulaceae bacterium]